MNAVNGTSVAMTWLPPAREGQNGFIHSYAVMVAGVNTEDNFTVFTNTSDITISSLHPFYSYRFSVAAVTVSQGPMTRLITIKMPTSGEFLLS